MSDNPFNPFANPPAPPPPDAGNSLSRPGLLNGAMTPAALTRQGVAGQFHTPEARNLWFNNQTIHLDGYRFINCRFDKCILVIGSATIDLVNCFIDEETVLRWGPDLIKVIQLFNRKVLWMDAIYPNFVPTRNSDGTITLGAKNGR